MKKNTIEKLIDKSIKILIKKIEKIENELNSNPVSEMLELKIQFSNLLKKYSTYPYRQKEVQEFLEVAVEKEKKISEKIKRHTSKNFILKQIEKKVKLEMELSELQMEKVSINIRKNK